MAGGELGDTTLLVLGAGGQVGRVLVEQAGDRATGYTHQDLDICDAAAVARALSAGSMSVVVNCAGYTAVDRAESERSYAFAVNAQGAEIIARAAASRGLPVIHLSTDYVYSGLGTRPHLEDEAGAPVNAYGASKWAGDLAVTKANPAHLVLRVSWVFGVHGNNFVKTMLRLGREREELRIVSDQVGAPTEAEDIATAILSMVKSCRQAGFNSWGTYHFASKPTTTWYGFAKEIFQRTRRSAPRLAPIASSEYPTAATRPLNSALDCSKIQRVFAIEQPDWRIALSRVMARMGEVSP